MTDVETDYVPMKGDTVLVQELAKGSTKLASANMAGVDVGTVTKRLKDPAFRKLVRDHRTDFLDEVAGVLASSAVGAALVLEGLYQDESEPAHVRRSAARDVLEFTIRIREFHELDLRVDELEELMEQASLESSYD